MLRGGEAGETVQCMVSVCGPVVSGFEFIRYRICRAGNGDGDGGEGEGAGREPTHLGGLSRRPPAGCWPAQRVYSCRARRSKRESCQ